MNVTLRVINSSVTCEIKFLIQFYLYFNINNTLKQIDEKYPTTTFHSLDINTIFFDFIVFPMSFMKSLEYEL